MDVEFINPFINATLSTIKTMTQTNPKVGKPYLKTNNLTFGIATGVIGMGGPVVAGNLAISFDEKCILELVSNMFMEEFSEITDEVMDAVGELTNVIAGGAKRELGEKGYSFDMATPIMIKGEKLEVQQFGRAPIIVIPFSTDTGQFVCEANLAKIKK